MLTAVHRHDAKGQGAFCVGCAHAPQRHTGQGASVSVWFLYVRAVCLCVSLCLFACLRACVWCACEGFVGRYHADVVFLVCRCFKDSPTEMMELSGVCVCVCVGGGGWVGVCVCD